MLTTLAIANYRSRQVQIGTHSPVLADDGANLAAALQTIREIGDGEVLDTAIGDAFPGALVVLDEPETRLHPDLLPSLARLIERASR
jgi:predicted ATPase